MPVALPAWKSRLHIPLRDLIGTLRGGHVTSSSYFCDLAVTGEAQFADEGMPDVEDGEMTRDNVKSKASQVLAAQVRTASRIPSIIINTVLWSERRSKRCLAFTDGLCCVSAGEEEEAAETGARQMSGISSCRVEMVIR